MAGVEVGEGREGGEPGDVVGGWDGGEVFEDAFGAGAAGDCCGAAGAGGEGGDGGALVGGGAADGGGDAAEDAGAGWGCDDW